MRAKELDSLLGHLRAYDTVRLVAGREFGRTTLLRQLDTALVARGLSVVRISGDPLLAGARYAALREILPSEKLQHQATPSEVRDVLAVEFSRFPNTVVLIDDAECLDLASAQAIAPLLTRSSVAGVCVTPPIEQMTADQRAVAATLRADVRIELRALSFEQVGVLAESLLGGTVEPDIASEVFSMSSGVTGIAADILRTGRTTGQITLRGGRWVLTGRSLWNSHLEETVERLISPLSTSTTTALHALAISGSLPATDLYAHDAQAADTLTRQGLVTTFLDPHGQTRVAPRPALITDYFRHRPVDLLHFAAAATLHTLCPETPGQQEEATDDASVLPRLTSHVQHSDAQDTHNAGLARYLREDAEIQLADSSRRWRRDGDVASAATYLDTLLRSGGYVATAVEVLERTSSDTSDGESLLRLALHEMALMSEATPPASGHVAAIRRDHDEYAPALDAYAAYVAFSATGRDATVDAWLARSGSDPTGLSEAVAAFIRVATGEALPVDVPPHEGQHIPLHRAIIEQTRVLTRARHAARTDTLQELLADPIDLATGDDPFSFLIDSYVRSQLLLTLGQVNEARQTLSNALSVGDLDLTVGSLYAAMLRWSAFCIIERDAATSPGRCSPRAASMRLSEGLSPACGRSLARRSRRCSRVTDSLLRRSFSPRPGSVRSACSSMPVGRCCALRSSLTPLSRASSSCVNSAATMRTAGRRGLLTSPRLRCGRIPRLSCTSLR